MAGLFGIHATECQTSPAAIGGSICSGLVQVIHCAQSQQARDCAPCRTMSLPKRYPGCSPNAAGCPNACRLPPTLPLVAMPLVMQCTAAAPTTCMSRAKINHDEDICMQKI